MKKTSEGTSNFVRLRSPPIGSTHVCFALDLLHIEVHIHIQIQTHVHSQKHVHLNKQIHVQIHKHKCPHTHIHIQKHKQKDIQIQKHIDIYKYICIYISSYLHIFIFIARSFLTLDTLFLKQRNLKKESHLKLLRRRRSRSSTELAKQLHSTN